MAWQEEIIASREEAKAFLAKYLPEVVGRPLLCQPVDFETGTGLRVFCKNDDPASGFEDAQKVLTLNFMASPGFALLNPYSIYPAFRKIGLAPLPLKACVGVAYEYGATKIEIQDVMDNGWSFWPHMGATPGEEPASVDQEIRDALKRQPWLSTEIAAAFSAIARTPSADGFERWQDVAETPRTLPANAELRKDIWAFQSDVFQRCSSSSSLYLDLARPRTRAMMEKYMGPLPPFDGAGRGAVGPLNQAGVA